MRRFFKFLLNLWRSIVRTLHLRKLQKSLTDEVTDKFLEHLLYGMDLLLTHSSEFNKNIQDFEARYLFKDKSGKIAAAVQFSNGGMQVFREAIPNCDVVVTFKDGKALRDFLKTSNPDIIGFIFENRVSFEGNFNYLLKFIYMSNHILYKASLIKKGFTGFFHHVAEAVGF